MLSKEECFKALNSFSKNKTPGTDGLSAEFYQFFWKEISESMIDSFNYSFAKEEMSISQRRGVISLIPKKKRNPLFLENWRPISLLNVDYKIATKSISNRIEKILPSIINLNQTGYVKSRYIGENIRLISDIMEHTVHQKIPGALIFIDFKKAFDSLEWSFMFEALKTFNFGPNLITWIRTFYQNISSCVINNGFASNFFALQRGVRQGCPLSGPLFVLSVEMLAYAINNNPTIRGICIDQNEIKLTQYADDTTCFVQDETSIQNILIVLDNFKRISGLEPNLSKTEAMWIGSKVGAPSKPFGLRWTSEPVLALGVFFSYDKQLSDQLNFYNKLDQLENTLSSWKKRNISLYGKINITKTLALSKLTFNASVLCIPDNFAEKVDKITFKFIWDNKPAKIKKKTIIGSKGEGGLDMTMFTHIEKALKLAWVKRLLDPKQSAWKIIPRHSLSKYGGLFLLACDFNTKELNLPNTPDFYKQILSYIQDFNEQNYHFQDIMQIPIWNNKYIKVGNTSVYYRAWFDKGIITIKDLLGSNNTFLSFSEFIKKFNVNTNFLTYSGIINAVRDKIKQTETSSSLEKTYYKLTKMSTRSIRQLFAKVDFEPPTNEYLIIKEGVQTKDLNRLYLLPFRVTKEIKLSIFQIKIIHNILPLKDYLKKVGIKADDICPFCSDSKRHTCKHFFYLCKHAQCFWNEFQNWWLVHIDPKSQITLDTKTVLYGQLSNFRSSLLFNHLILIAKQHMYYSFIKEEKYSFQSFLNYATNKYQLEKRIALAQINERSSAFFGKKWAPFTNFLQKPHNIAI